MKVFKNKIHRISILGLLLILNGCDTLSYDESSQTLRLRTTGENSSIQTISIPLETTMQDNEEVITQMEEELLELKRELIQAISPAETSSIISQFLEEVNINLLEFLETSEIQISAEPTLDQYHSAYSKPFGDVEAVYLTKENRILFKYETDKQLKENLTQHFYHELGHAVDTNLGDLAMSETFKLIFEEGKEIIFPGDEGQNPYYRENVWEYFAESFSLFFKNPEQLARHEETYKFMCTVMELIN